MYRDKNKYDPTSDNLSLVSNETSLYISLPARLTIIAKITTNIPKH